MTSEVIVMNKNGIALAADSAATLMPSRQTYHTQTKIFSLTRRYPIGIMVHERLRLNGTPWETIIKMYRSSHNACGFDRIEEYLEHLVQFISGNDRLFDREHPELYWVCDILSYLEKLGRKIEADWHHHRNEENSPQVPSLMQFAKQQLESKIEALRRCSDCPEMADDLFRAELNTALAGIETLRLEQSFGLYPLQNDNLGQIKELLRLLTIKNDFSLGYSGVVLAGFGEGDVFPVVASARLGGFYFGRLKCARDKAVTISHHNQAQIIPYATTHMMTSFLKGVHPEYESNSLAESYQMMENLVADLGRQLKIDQRPENRALLNRLIDTHFYHYKCRLARYVLENHIRPVIDGVRFLPKDSLPAIAESLINVTSFKTSFRPDQHSVGGAIDVALISKGDGFIWVKRKQSFNPEDNIDFIERDTQLSRI